MLGKGPVYIPIDTNVFADPDDGAGALTYSAFVEYHINRTGANKKRQLLYTPRGYWLKFDPKRIVVWGTPTTSDIEFNRSESRFYQAFTVIVQCSDGVAAVNASFSLVIQNSRPQQQRTTLQQIFN